MSAAAAIIARTREEDQRMSQDKAVQRYVSAVGIVSDDPTNLGGIKCVICDAPAEYISQGDSLCPEHQRIKVAERTKWIRTLESEPRDCPSCGWRLP
jgi:hypothetical protein